MEWKYGLQVKTTFLYCQVFEQGGRYVHVCHYLVHTRTIVMHFKSVLQDGTVTLQCKWMIQTHILEVSCRTLVGLGLLEIHFFCKSTVETVIMDLWMVIRPLSIMVSWYCVVKAITVFILWGCYHLQGLHLPVHCHYCIGTNFQIQIVEISNPSSTTFATSPSDEDLVIETRTVTQNWKYVIRTKRVWVDCRMVYQRADLYEWQCRIQIRTIIVHCQCVIRTRSVAVHHGYVMQTRSVVIRRRRVVRLQTLVMRRRYQICAWTGIRPRIGVLPAMYVLVDWGTITHTRRVSHRFCCMTCEQTFNLHRRCSIRTQVTILQLHCLVRTRINLMLERYVILQHRLSRNLCWTFQWRTVYTFCTCLMPICDMCILQSCVNTLAHCAFFSLNWNWGFQIFTAMFDSRIYIQDTSVFIFFRCVAQIRNLIISCYYRISMGRIDVWICCWWESVTLVVDWRCVIEQTGVLIRWVCLMGSLSMETVQQI